MPLSVHVDLIFKIKSKVTFYSFSKPIKCKFSLCVLMLLLGVLYDGSDSTLKGRSGSSVPTPPVTLSSDDLPTVLLEHFSAFMFMFYNPKFNYSTIFLIARHENRTRK